LAEEDSRPRASPGLVERCEFLSQLREGGHQQQLAAIRSGPWPGLDERARRLLSFFPALAPRLHAQLIDAGKLPVPLQPCIRDIWHDHVLFTGDEVTGLIDFGAMRPECVATDIARLLGSLLLDDADGWRLGLASYQEVRPLSSNELHLVGVFDHSATLLSGLNWLRWIFLEGRQFADATRILARLDETLRRLQVLAERGARS
jgi:homoserine kinase type II